MTANPAITPPQEIVDYVIIGSGFGGSVSAMRLAEKGYKVLVLERGKRYADNDFPKSNWNFQKYLWMPPLRSFGILQMSLLSGMLILHGSGVGGGSLGYANVLMEPSDAIFDDPAWKDLADWKKVLAPHYQTAKRMLGVTQTPRLDAADTIIQEIADRRGAQASFMPTNVGVFFGDAGEEGKKFSDPYFGGEGPERHACNFCGGCMVGCRYNAKNTLVKNYLYFAEKLGVDIYAEAEVKNIEPIAHSNNSPARYKITYQKTTGWLVKNEKQILTRNVIVSAGVMGTLKLLFHCRDTTKSLPNLSPKLGERVRTNSEALLGATARKKDIDYSQGIAIASVFDADEVTKMEPVRYPAKSGLMRLLSWPLLDYTSGFLGRLWQIIVNTLRHPIDLLSMLVFPGWAERTTILLVMQTEDNKMNVQYGREPWSLFRKRLVIDKNNNHQIPTKIEIGHQITREFAQEINGIEASSIAEGLLGMPSTAHILGGIAMGKNIQEGVVDLDCQVFNYPGLFVIDGSIMPANPGINPSLTITALAEYAMSKQPNKST